MLPAPVSRYATADVVTVRDSTTTEGVRSVLDRCRISAVPVIDHDERLVGVVSLSDLLEVGRVEQSPAHGRVALQLAPDQRVTDVMSKQPVTVAPTTSVSEAAALMVDRHIHRVFLEDDRRVVGVFSTKDVMRALVDADADLPISKLMHSPVDTVRPDTPLSRADEMLRESGRSGLVVESDGWPLGVFTKREALTSRHRAADTPVREVMGFSLLRLPPSTTAGQAAGEAFATRARRIVVMEPAEILGILTGIDLAGAAVMR